MELPLTRGVGVNTESDVFKELKTKVRNLEGEVEVMAESEGSKFSFKSIATGDAEVIFTLAFHLISIYKFVFISWVQRLQESVVCPQSLPPLLFGLLEQTLPIALECLSPLFHIQTTEQIWLTCTTASKESGYIAVENRSAIVVNFYSMS